VEVDLDSILNLIEINYININIKGHIQFQLDNYITLHHPE